MHILYLSQYFPPEAGATQARAYDMARSLVNAGHRVTMISEIPNHPSGIILPPYRGKIWERASLDGIDVIRVWVKTSPAKSKVTRLILYLSYMVHATLAGLLLARSPYHLVYVSSPPLFVGVAGLVLSVLRDVPMVFEVRDLWPESAVSLGELSNRTALALASKLEEACYRKAVAVVVVTKGILDRLVERKIPFQKLTLIPNGANVELFQFRPDGRARLRRELGLNDKFVAIYAGIHGIAQGLETVVEAARQLRKDSDVHFLMVGEGPKKTEVAALAAHYKLPNLTLLPEQPRELIPDYLSAADVALIPLRNLDLFKSALPSKLFDAWACQRPVLLSVDGEARRIMEQAQGGLFVPPEDPEKLADALRALKQDPILRERMGLNGRTFTIKHYSRQALAAELNRLLEEKMGRRD